MNLYMHFLIVKNDGTVVLRITLKRFIYGQPVNAVWHASGLAGIFMISILMSLGRFQQMHLTLVRRRV